MALAWDQLVALIEPMRDVKVLVSILFVADRVIAGGIPNLLDLPIVDWIIRLASL